MFDGALLHGVLPELASNVKTSNDENQSCIDGKANNDDDDNEATSLQRKRRRKNDDNEAMSLQRKRRRKNDQSVLNNQQDGRSVSTGRGGKADKSGDTRITFLVNIWLDYVPRHCQPLEKSILSSLSSHTCELIDSSKSSDESCIRCNMYVASVDEGPAPEEVCLVEEETDEASTRTGDWLIFPLHTALGKHSKLGRYLSLAVAPQLMAVREQNASCTDWGQSTWKVVRRGASASRDLD